MPPEGKSPGRARVVMIDGKAFDVVWDGHKDAPSLLPSECASGVIDFQQEYEIAMSVDPFRKRYAIPYGEIAIPGDEYEEAA